MVRYSLAISLLKAASAAGAGEALGKLLKNTARAGKKVVQGAGDVGAGIARGAGVNEGLGRLAGYGTTVGAGYLGGKRVKRKFDEWRWRYGLL